MDNSNINPAQNPLANGAGYNNNFGAAAPAGGAPTSAPNQGGFPSGGQIQTNPNPMGYPTPTGQPPVVPNIGQPSMPPIAPKKSNGKLFAILAASVFLVLCIVFAVVLVAGKSGENVAVEDDIPYEESYEVLDGEDLPKILLDRLHMGYDQSPAWIVGETSDEQTAIDVAKYLYETEDYKEISDLTDEYRLAVAAYAVFDDAGYSSDTDEGVKIPETKIIETAENIFGTNFESLQLSTVSACPFGIFRYDAAASSFTWGSPACGSTIEGSRVFANNLVSARQYPEHLEIIEQVAIISFGKIPEDGDSENTPQTLISAADGKVLAEDLKLDLDDLGAEARAKYLDLFDTYRYTFVKEGDNWTFSEIQRMD